MELVANQEDEVYTSYTVQTRTPDGTLYTIIMEDSNGHPKQIIASIGKAGSGIQAWTEALARMCSLALDNGSSLIEIESVLSNLTSDRLRAYKNGAVCRSGPEGLVLALRLYRRDKFREQKRRLNVGIRRSTSR